MFWAVPWLLDAPQKFGAYLVYLVFSLNVLEICLELEASHFSRFQRLFESKFTHMAI